MLRSKKQQNINRKPLHVRTGDMVIVISGDGKSNTPRQVLSVLPKEGKVIVEGINIMKDRQRKQQGGRAAGINDQDFIEKPYPIDRSKVALIDPKTQKRTRVKIKTEADGRRIRVAGKSGETI